MKKLLSIISVLLYSTLLFAAPVLKTHNCKTMSIYDGYEQAFNENAKQGIFIGTFTFDDASELMDRNVITYEFYENLSHITNGYLIKYKCMNANSTLYVGLNPGGGYSFVCTNRSNFYKCREYIEQYLGLQLTEFYNNKMPGYNLFKYRSKPPISEIFK